MLGSLKVRSLNFRSLDLPTSSSSCISLLLSLSLCLFLFLSLTPLPPSNQHAAFGPLKSLIPLSPIPLRVRDSMAAAVPRCPIGTWPRSAPSLSGPAARYAVGPARPDPARGPASSHGPRLIHSGVPRLSVWRPAT
eukprot:758780-Hanusia_phi.AAC.5